jgi:hypothetical protein
MTETPRPIRQAQKRSGQPPRGDTIPQKKSGRPKGPPSTIVNLRLPVDLLARLDRYIDRLEVQTGLKANRGMIARRALEYFLETRTTGKSER